MFKALYPRTIWLMFLSFSAIILSVGLFRYWMPNQEDATNKVTQANAMYDEGGKLGQAVKKKNNAIVATHKAEEDWIPYVLSRTPDQNTADRGININVNGYKLAMDTKRFRNNVQRAVNAQCLKGGVKVISGPLVDLVNDGYAPNGILASYYNYPAIPFPVVIYDLGQVTVQGTYKQITDNVRAWSDMPHFLAVAHNLQITGTSPQLTGTYDVSMVGYIRYDGMFGPIPDVGGSATTTRGGTGGPSANFPGRNAPQGGPQGPTRAGTGGGGGG